MKLQFIHNETGAHKASSLYCRWVVREQESVTRLVAIWIDSEMRPFASGEEPAKENKIFCGVELNSSSGFVAPDMEEKRVTANEEVGSNRAE